MQRSPRRRRGRLATVASAVLLAASTTACGAVGDLVASRRSQEPPVAVVGVVVPLSGSQAVAGAGVRDAVRLAVEAAGDIGEWRVELTVVDDGGTPESAAAAVAELVEDRRLVAVVGGLSGPVVRVLQPVLDRQGVVLVSPADTDRAHTRGADSSAPLRPYGTYFTVATPGVSEPAAAAAHLSATLGAGAVVATVGSGTTASNARVSEFAREAGARGLSVVPISLVPPPPAPAAEGTPGTEGTPGSEGTPGTEDTTGAEETPVDEGAPAPEVGPGADAGGEPGADAGGEPGADAGGEPGATGGEDGAVQPAPGTPPGTGTAVREVVPAPAPEPVDPIAAAVQAAREAGAAGVYTGAEAEPSAALVAALLADGSAVPVVGSSTLLGDEFLAAAGGAAETVVATSPPPQAATAGQDGALGERFAAAGLDAAPGPFGAAAYDAGTAVVQALTRCLPAASTVRTAREGCLGEMAQVSFDGLTGPVAFTDLGERADTGPSLWQVSAGTWGPLG